MVAAKTNRRVNLSITFEPINLVADFHTIPGATCSTAAAVPAAVMKASSFIAQLFGVVELPKRTHKPR